MMTGIRAKGKGVGIQKVIETEKYIQEKYLLVEGGNKVEIEKKKVGGRQ